MVHSLFQPQEIASARGSLTDYTCEGGPPTAPLSCNLEQELVGLGPGGFFHDPPGSSSIPVSSSFSESWPSQVSWTALMFCHYPNLAIDHVWIWRTRYVLILHAWDERVRFGTGVLS